MKLLALTKKIHPSPRGGRELLSKLNQDVLAALFGDDYIRYELPSDHSNLWRTARNAVRGYVDGINTATIQHAIQIIEREKVNQVFIDGSNLGGFTKALKRRLPQVETITFFHNVEVRFFWGSFLARKSMRALAVLIANYLAERKAVRNSDTIICLSDRDSHLLKKLYGRGATHIAPMVLEDKCPPDFTQSPDEPPEYFALFVGGAFYANRTGISWFVREVVPWIDIPVVIVGKGFETMRVELERPGKVTVIGEVDSLSDWYRRCQFVIAPIFDGSGMKTKVAEALMYGKKIIGTPEAFVGYEPVVEQAGAVCSTAREFITAINGIKSSIRYSFDANLRAIYEQFYSKQAAMNRLESILRLQE